MAASFQCWPILSPARGRLRAASLSGIRPSLLFPEHRELFVKWVGELAAGSWLAIQMPGNFESPSHAAVRAVARRALAELRHGRAVTV